MPYIPTKHESFWTAAARYWWSEELTTQQRLDYMIVAIPLIRHIESKREKLGPVDTAELLFKLARYVDKHEEGINATTD